MRPSTTLVMQSRLNTNSRLRGASGRDKRPDGFAADLDVAQIRAAEARPNEDAAEWAAPFMLQFNALT